MVEIGDSGMMNEYGEVVYPEVHDGVREFIVGERMTSERLNEVLRLSASAKKRAQYATRLLTFSIVLTIIDIVLALKLLWPGISRLFL